LPQYNIVPNHKQFWDELTAAKLNSTIFTVSVIEPVVKGVPDRFDGLISVSGVLVQVTKPFTTSFPRLAFIPLSQMDTYLPRRIRPDQKKEIIAAGTRLRVLVLDATQEKQRITLSERAARYQAYIEFWRRTKVNDILLARVASGLNESKFHLTIGGVDFHGRVSISLDELSDDEAFLFKIAAAQQDPASHNSTLPIGTEFEVVVTAISPINHSVMLSAKRIQKFKVGNRETQGTVVKVFDSSNCRYSGLSSDPKPGDRLVAIGADGIGQLHVLVREEHCGNRRLARKGDLVRLKLATDETGGELWYIRFKSA
jgi:ribosomal protein S1